jgi:hypothetical protein
VYRFDRLSPLTEILVGVTRAEAGAGDVHCIHHATASKLFEDSGGAAGPRRLCLVRVDAPTKKALKPLKTVEATIGTRVRLREHGMD